jgi:hypothetical protein
MKKKEIINAILIDVENREVKEILIDSSIESIHSTLKCTCITCAEDYIFRTVDHALFVDDEGLLTSKPLGAFQILQGQVISGNGLIVGIDEEGESVDHNFDIDSFIPMVRFADVSELPEPSFEIYSF